MQPKHSIQRYRKWYSKLLRLYPKPYYERFGEGMEQTFSDMLRESAHAGDRGLFGQAVALSLETAAGIIRENITFTYMNKKNIIRVALITALLLMIPVIGMQVSSEWNWTLSDFVFAGVFIFGTGLAYEFISSRSAATAYKGAVAVALVSGFLLIWINLAVGIIGTEDTPLNGMYFLVILLGLIGAAISRLRPLGMARTLCTMAVAQASVPFIAFFVARPVVAGNERGIIGVFVLSFIFAAAFGASSWLFRKAIAAERA